MSGFASCAKKYHDRGWNVMPIRPKEKKPFLAWEKYQKTRVTEEEINSWSQLYPKHNIAIITGKVSNLVVLDVDGEEGKLALKGKHLPPTLTAKTGRGFHYFYAMPQNLTIGNSVGILPKVDIRGEGGYVVGAGSMHENGSTYEWVQEEELAICPEWIAAIQSQPKQKKSKPSSEKVKEPAPEGQRNDKCAELAGWCFAKGYAKDDVLCVVRDWNSKNTPPLPDSEIVTTVESIANKDSASKEKREEAISDSPFQCLGYDKGHYFFLPNGSRQVTELRGQEFSKLKLFTLAPADYWREAYPAKQGINWDSVANRLIQECHAKGVFDPSIIRGRGAWWESGHAVLHLGDHIYADGAKTPISKFPHGRYIYQADKPIRVNTDSPLDQSEAHKLLEIADKIVWEKPIYGNLFAGWLAVAPICGALSWRPHVWLNGASGAGKTFIINNVVRPLLGDIALPVQSATSEAGIRQELNHDARPVIFDEAESEDQHAHYRIQNILNLIRQASSESGAAIVKGTPSGLNKTYRVRSCFMLSSIGSGIEKHADRNRISILSLLVDQSEGHAERFATLKKLVADVLTPEYSERFVARSIKMIPTIRENSRIFSLAAAKTIGNQRLGDQIGSLLAGYYSLEDDKPVTLEDAQAWVAEQDWADEEHVKNSSDEQGCLRRILEHVLKVQSHMFMGDRTIEELILVAATRKADDKVLPSDATACLMRSGIRVDGDAFTVSSSHETIAKIMANTSWRKWSPILKRLPGTAEIINKRFGSFSSRGISIPIDILIGGQQGE